MKEIAVFLLIAISDGYGNRGNTSIVGTFYKETLCQQSRSDAEKRVKNVADVKFVCIKLIGE